MRRVFAGLAVAALAAVVGAAPSNLTSGTYVLSLWRTEASARLQSIDSRAVSPFDLPLALQRRQCITPCDGDFTCPCRNSCCFDKSGCCPGATMDCIGNGACCPKGQTCDGPKICPTDPEKYECALDVGCCYPGQRCEIDDDLNLTCAGKPSTSTTHTGTGTSSHPSSTSSSSDISTSTPTNTHSTTDDPESTESTSSSAPSSSSSSENTGTAPIAVSQTDLPTNVPGQFGVQVSAPFTAVGLVLASLVFALI
ncbi:hypothetical protein BKA62DRAFT_726272 [Auriculariales sp. MPI-PUGE-AT-0066]|nr:hypothetical protein BKA62DRAFT_726272 [Auriculariales sp. MPI-PUGE-AT-0066]